MASQWSGALRAASTTSGGGLGMSSPVTGSPAVIAACVLLSMKPSATRRRF